MTKKTSNKKTVLRPSSKPILRWTGFGNGRIRRFVVWGLLTSKLTLVCGLTTAARQTTTSLLQRCSQTATHALNAVGSLGHKPMQADIEPPGHPEGDGGAGGDGGDGDGPPPVVDPISPDLTLEKVTDEPACFFSRSSGLPESVE